MTDDDDDDVTLVEAWKHGDELAKARLFSRHAEKLRAYLRRGCASRYEDLLQETLLIGLASKDRLRSNAAFGAWLRGIARNLMRADRRHAHRWDATVLTDGFVCDEQSPFDRAAEHEARGRIEGALEALPEKERDVLAAYWKGDATVEMIARRMGVPSPTTRTRLARGVRRLRSTIHVTGLVDQRGARLKKS